LHDISQVLMLHLSNGWRRGVAAKIVLTGRSFFPNRQKNLLDSQKMDKTDKNRGKKTRPAQLSGLVKQYKNSD